MSKLTKREKRFVKTINKMESKIHKLERQLYLAQNDIAFYRYCSLSGQNPHTGRTNSELTA